MNELTEISSIWIIGTLECSFTTSLYLKDDLEGVKLNHIKPVGRKILLNAESYTDVLPKREEASFLEDQYILGLEVFPKINGIYPLDIARKYNAKEVIIQKPEISEIREINGIRHGLLKAQVSCRLYRLKDAKLTPEFKDSIKNDDQTTIKIDQVSDFEGSKRTRNGCLGALIPNPNSGPRNLSRLGCGGFISLLMIFGLIGLFMRACNNNIENDSSETAEIRDDSENKDEINFTDTLDNVRTESNKTDTVNSVNTETIVLPNVQFFTNSNKLLPSSAKDLNGLSIYLLENLDCKANIYGHTDNRGDDNANLRLSLSRANSVLDYLMDKGIDRSRLQAFGKGETEPRASNSSAEGMLMNRRVEIEIIRRKKIK
jgi:outer membrane protein OmpA-like peptidoglycan-associated protein